MDFYVNVSAPFPLTAFYFDITVDHFQILLSQSHEEICSVVVPEQVKQKLTT